MSARMSGWERIKGTTAVQRKTSNGWWQVREDRDDASVAFSSRDSMKAWQFAHERFAIYSREAKGNV
jgi:hypothetical protein